MKYLFFLLLLPSFLQAQTERAKRSYSDSTGKYIIIYDYESGYAMVPAIAGSEPHYDASITVYKLVPHRCFVKKYDTVLIGKPIHGTYVPNGCFEDSPANWVNQAYILYEAAKKKK